MSWSVIVWNVKILSLLATKKIMSIVAHAAMNKTTYSIIRMYKDERPSELIASGQTLAQAQAHCRREDTHTSEWFDGYNPE